MLFWSKMHWGRWLLRLRPRPRYGSLEGSPRPANCEYEIKQEFHLCVDGSSLDPDLTGNNNKILFIILSVIFEFWIIKIFQKIVIYAALNASLLD
jgi:hypothetical protein